MFCLKANLQMLRQCVYILNSRQIFQETPKVGAVSP
jgi:hypothetical protein